MAIVKLSPSEIFFSQDSISNCFGSYTPHRNKTIGETLDDIISGKCTLTALPTINVIKKGNKWVTADNRRLWVFKKLQKLGKCHMIDAEVTYYIKPTKCHILSSTRVRGKEGGTLWRSLESKQPNPYYRTPVNPFISQREASLDSMSFRDRTEHSSEASSQMCSVSDSTFPGNYGVARRTGYSGLTSISSITDQTTKNDSQREFRPTSVCQTSHETYKSEAKLTEICSSKVAWSEEKKVVRQTNPNYRTPVNPFISQREASLDSLSLSDRTEHSSEASSQMCSVSDSTFRGYRGVASRTGYSGLTSISSKREFRPTSVCQTSREAYESETKLTKTCSIKVAWSEEEKVVRQPYTKELVKTVNLNPLDVGFAGGSRYFVSFDGNLMGECLDKNLQMLAQKMITFKLKVFIYQGKYYSKERMRLWMMQSLNRISDKFTIVGDVVPTPANILTIQLRDSLKSFDRVGGEKWKQLTMLHGLPTKKRQFLYPADILYSTKAILDAYKGHSIVKELIKVYSSETTSHEISVIEHNCKYYALENKKLWILKNAEVARGPLTVTGNVKISMDYIMFNSFTSDNIRDVDIKMDLTRHTTEERFMLEYIRRVKTS